MNATYTRGGSWPALPHIERNPNKVKAVGTAYPGAPDSGLPHQSTAVNLLQHTLKHVPIESRTIKQAITHALTRMASEGICAAWCPECGGTLSVDTDDQFDRGHCSTPTCSQRGQ